MSSWAAIRRTGTLPLRTPGSVCPGASPPWPRGCPSRAGAVPARRRCGHAIRPGVTLPHPVLKARSGHTGTTASRPPRLGLWLCNVRHHAIESRRAEGTNLAGALYLSQQLGLVDDMLHYFDRVSMANSLEVRVPFLDHRVVEYCSGVPDRLKVRRLEGKHLLRVVARGLIPERIIEKKKVGFFNHAVNAWFAQQADHAVADYLCTPDPAYAEIIDPQYVEELVLNSRAPTTRSSSALLLSILMLEIWLSSFLPAAIRDHSVTESASSPSR